MWQENTLEMLDWEVAKGLEYFVDVFLINAAKCRASGILRMLARVSENLQDSGVPETLGILSNESLKHRWECMYFLL